MNCSLHIKLLFILISVLVASCTKAQNVKPMAVEVTVKRSDPIEDIDTDARYITELEMSRQVWAKYRRLKHRCTARRIFVYFEDYQPEELARFPSMAISVFGKRFFIESYTRDEQRLRFYAKKIAEFGKAESPILEIVDFQSSLMIEVTVLELPTIPQIVYLFRHDKRGFKYTRIQYICRDVPGRLVKKYFKEWVRYQKEFVTQ